MIRPVYFHVHSKMLFSDSSINHFSRLCNPSRACETHRRAHEDAYRVWKREFEGIYELGRYFGLTCHPQSSGMMSRLNMLERLIEEMKRIDDVWFTTC